MAKKNYTPMYNSLKNRKEGFIIEAREDEAIYTRDVELEQYSVPGATNVNLKLTASDMWITNVEYNMFENDVLRGEHLLTICNVLGIDTTTGVKAESSDFTVDLTTVNTASGVPGAYSVKFTWDGTESIEVTVQLYILEGTVDCENSMVYDPTIATEDSNRSCNKGRKSQTKLSRMDKFSGEIDYDANDEILAERGFTSAQIGAEGTILATIYHFPTLQRFSGEYNTILNSMTMDNDNLIKYNFDYTLYGSSTNQKIKLDTGVADYSYTTR